MSRLLKIIWGFLLSLFLLLGFAVPALAAPDDPTAFSQQSFSQLPAIESSGSVEIEGTTRQWQAGQTPDQFLTLGDIGSLQPGAMSVDSIAQVTGVERSEIPISDYALLSQQSVSSLLEADPNLGQLSVQDVPALQSLFGEKAGSVVDAETLQSGTLAQVVEQFPQLGELQLNAIDLQQFALSSMPGASSTPLSQYSGWENQTIDSVPGMNEVPLDSFPNSTNVIAGGGFLRIDFVHGPEEARRTNTISGSDVQGFRVPCTTEGEADCAYIELDDSENQGDSAQGALEGVQWVSGKYQEVDGGHGFLRMVNGGKEPTGRLPFGDVFKVVVWEPNETDDSVTTALFTRYCYDAANCTPYFIGPIPFLTYERDSAIFVGLIQPEIPSNDSSTPTGAEKGGGWPAMATFDAGAFGMGLGMGGSGNGQTCTVDPTKLDAATKAAIAAADPAAQAGAPDMVPYIMNACAQAGITDTDQLAYILATAEHETDHFRTMNEYSRNMYDRCGWGEGMIQVTWCDGKERVFQRLGLPAYGGINDKRLAQPDIAAQALCRGMKEGWFGRRRPISECIGGGRVDYLCARQQVNSNDDWQQIGARADRYKAGLAGAGGATGNNAVICQAPTGGAAGATGTNGTGAPTGDAPAGAANQRIMQAVNQNWGMNTKDCPGTRNGQLACACGVNRMLMQAGLRPIGAGREGTYSVSVLHDALRAGRGTEVSAAQSQPGDIIILYGPNGNRHTGFCANAGCTQAVSNSSSNGAFSWRSDGYFSPSYGPRSRRHIFRPN